MTSSNANHLFKDLLFKYGHTGIQELELQCTNGRRGVNSSARNTVHPNSCSSGMTICSLFPKSLPVLSHSMTNSKSIYYKLNRNKTQVMIHPDEKFLFRRKLVKPHMLQSGHRTNTTVGGQGTGISTQKGDIRRKKEKASPNEVQNPENYISSTGSKIIVPHPLGPARWQQHFRGLGRDTTISVKRDCPDLAALWSFGFHPEWQLCL